MPRRSTARRELACVFKTVEGIDNPTLGATCTIRRREWTWTGGRGQDCWIGRASRSGDARATQCRSDRCCPAAGHGGCASVRGRPSSTVNRGSSSCSSLVIEHPRCVGTSGIKPAANRCQKQSEKRVGARWHFSFPAQWNGKRRVVGCVLSTIDTATNRYSILTGIAPIQTHWSVDDVCVKRGLF